MNSEPQKIVISNSQELNHLIQFFFTGPQFAMEFEFTSEDLWKTFLNRIGIDFENFNKSYSYFNSEKSIHISESGEGCVWISTMGLVAKSKMTENKYVNACSYQKRILIHLLDDAILLSEDPNTYDIDSANYAIVEELTPSLFHNTIFYFETLAKAYLSINHQSVPKTHKLKQLFDLVKNTMFKKHQNNTLFHAYTIPTFEGVVKHISSIPGPFAEQYVKYDDNPQDITLIEFHPQHLREIRDIVEVTYDIILDMFYEKENCLYLGENLYQRLLNKCSNDNQREHIKKVYGFLIEED